jgi:hypothetical protein
VIVMRARPRALRACLAGALALLLLAAGPAAVRAAPPGWEETASTIAAPWPALQGSDGHFADYVVRRAPGPDRDDYGDAMLGYGLLAQAARTGDARLRDSGLRAIGRALRAGGSRANAPFRSMALAAAYNVARASFSDASLFASERERWERALRRIRLTRLGRTELTNKTLVEAVEVLELERTGLRSTVSGTVLADPDRAMALVRRLLSRDLPRAARPFSRGAGTMIGDFPGLPPAYHALAGGMLARAVDLLGSETPGSARRLLRSAADASAALAAPDGDVAYFGRSQEESWTLPLTAYGAEVAARAGGRRATYQALSERAFGRLGDAYGAGREGFFITPALAQDLRGGIAGLDPYAAAASYNGLTLVGAEWAIEAAAAERVPGTIAADDDGGRLLGRGEATFATVRSGDVWFAVKQARTAAADLRYDFGLVALRVRADDGSWRALPLRPRVERRGATAGPLLRRGRVTGLPEGRRMRLAGGGAVTVGGAFRTRSGRLLRRGVRFRFAPTGCGVRLAVPTRRGDRHEYSAFFSGSPRTAARSVADARQVVSFGSRATVGRRGRHASGAEPRLTEMRLRFAPAAAGKLTLETCAR